MDHLYFRLLVVAQLDNRARDSDERVRKAAVVAICEIAAEYSDAIPSSAIAEVLLRLRDKKVCTSPHLLLVLRYY